MQLDVPAAGHTYESSLLPAHIPQLTTPIAGPRPPGALLSQRSVQALAQQHLLVKGGHVGRGSTQLAVDQLRQLAVGLGHALLSLRQRAASSGQPLPHRRQLPLRFGGL